MIEWSTTWNESMSDLVGTVYSPISIKDYNKEFAKPAETQLVGSIEVGDSLSMSVATGFQKLVFGKVVVDKHSAVRTDELVFECNTCEAIHNPETTSFDKLCKSAYSVGWQVKWLDSGYTVHCKECSHAASLV